MKKALISILSLLCILGAAPVLADSTSNGGVGDSSISDGGLGNGSTSNGGVSSER